MRAAAVRVTGEEPAMSTTVERVLFVAAMVVVIVVVDVLFFKNDFWPRLAANVGIVLLFGAFYFRFLGRS